MGLYTRPIRSDELMHYNRALRPNELMHFGILGMKWGVRRYQNEDGTVTPEGRKRYYNADGSHKTFTKDAREYHKERKKKLSNIADGYEEQFNKSSEGKALKKAHDSAYRKMYNDTTDNEKIWKDFDKAESNYLKAEAKYSAKKMIAEHGEEAFRDYVMYMTKNSNYKTTGKSTNQLINDYAEYYRTIHSV